MTNVSSLLTIEITKVTFLTLRAACGILDRGSVALNRCGEVSYAK